MVLADITGNIKHFFGSVGDYIDDSNRKTIASYQMTVNGVPIVTYIMIGITCLILSYVTIMDNSNNYNTTTPAPITQPVYNQPPPNFGGSKKKTLRKNGKTMKSLKK